MATENVVPGQQAQGDVRSAIEAVERLAQPTVFDLDDSDDRVDVVALPRGLELKDMKPFRDARRGHPERRKGLAKLTTLDSFIEYVKRFESEHTSVFAIDDLDTPRLVCVFDHHDKGAEGTPRFGEHRAEYAFPLDEGWKAWQQVAKGSLTQAQLAALLEDRIADVMEPSMVGTTAQELATKLGIEIAGPSTLLTLSRGIAIRADLKVAQAMNLQTGEVRVSFEEAHQRESGAITVPGMFVIAVPVFREGQVYQIAVRLRYRRHESSVVWLLQLHRADVVFENAFVEACGRVKREIQGELYRGTPET